MQRLGGRLALEAAAGRASGHRRGSRARPGPSCGRASPRRPRRARHRHRAGRARRASSCPARRGSTSRSQTCGASASPWSGTSSSRSRSTPAPDGGSGVHALPRRQEPRQRALLGGLHLATQRRERRPPQAAQHVRVAPLALAATRTQLAANQPAARLELAKHGPWIHSVAARDVGGGEGPVGARVAAGEPGERLLHLLQEGIGQAARRHGAERVPIQAGVLGRDPALLAADPHPDGAALPLQLAEHAPGGHGLEAARLRLVLGQVTHARAARRGARPSSRRGCGR